MSEKEILFSVTAKDCRFDYFKAPGNGGQKKNKTESAVRCTHIASGAVGQASDTRSQPQNKKLAFVRMAQSEKFKKWHTIETARRLGKYVGLNQEVDNLMRDRYLRVEVKQDGKWIPESEQVDHDES